MSWQSRWQTIRRVGPTQVVLVRAWIAFGGDARARKHLNLQPKCLVIDVGAYEGEFTALMRQDWDARVVAIEPIPEFASSLEARFSDDVRVSVLAAALGAAAGFISISLSQDGSSAWVFSADSVEVPLVDVSDVVNDQQVALLKINAEGAEFDVLDRLVDTGQIMQVDTIQVQFHRFVPGARNRRKKIRRRLQDTHRCAWNVPWVWEQWVRRMP